MPKKNLLNKAIKILRDIDLKYDLVNTDPALHREIQMFFDDVVDLIDKDEDDRIDNEWYDDLGY
jgi:hypothetical protein